jgi:hypothetical protein
MVFVLANVTKLSMALLEVQRIAATGLASLRGVGGRSWVKFHPDLVNCIFWSCNSYRLQTSCDTSLRPEEGRGVSGATDGIGEGSLGKFQQL